MTSLLPDDPQEIRRIYLQLQEVPRSSPEQVDFVHSPKLPNGLLVSEALISCALIALPLIAISKTGGPPVIAAIVFTYLLSLIFRSIADARGRAVLGTRYAGCRALVAGPVSLVAYIVELEKLRTPEKPALRPIDVDVESLDVIEPVARAIAEPILRRARLEDQGYEGRANGHRAWTETLRRRLEELRVEESEEHDPVWKSAIVGRITEIEEEIRREEEEWSALERTRAKIAEEADAVEELLMKLTRRRRLLSEMSLSRRGAPEVNEAASDSVHDLRTRLQGLSESLAARDAGTDRLKAELEMRQLEGR